MFGAGLAWPLTADRERALEQLQDLASRHAPSVGMHDVPRESLGRHLGLTSRRDEDARDELDERLARA